MQSTLYNSLHLGIIMDGNGRWAERRSWPRLRGHEAGVEAIRRVVEAASREDVAVLTLYAFSSDNWRRPQAEVASLMGLLGRYLQNETDRLARDGIRLSVIGRRDRLPGTLSRAIAQSEGATQHGTTLHLRVAIDYSARAAIVNAAARASSPGDLTRTGFGGLITGETALPDVDLVIRTGGEKRLSDFLLWESAYAELYFTDCMWPDFDAEHLAEALASFRSRARRFGGLQELEERLPIRV